MTISCGQYLCTLLAMRHLLSGSRSSSGHMPSIPSSSSGDSESKSTSSLLLTAPYKLLNRFRPRPSAVQKLTRSRRLLSFFSCFFALTVFVLCSLAFSTRSLYLSFSSLSLDCVDRQLFWITSWSCYQRWAWYLSGTTRTGCSLVCWEPDRRCTCPEYISCESGLASLLK
jgi:hypothetical protein